MATYLLTWNPNKWDWNYLPEMIDDIGTDGYVVEKWSTGTTKRIEPGDRLFLMRLGKEPKGIVGSGTAMSKPYEHWHFNPLRAKARHRARFVEVRFDTLVDAEETPGLVLAIHTMKEKPLSNVNWLPQSPGTSIPDDAAAKLEAQWARISLPANKKHRERNRTSQEASARTQAHRMKERSRNISSKKKRLVSQQTGGLACEVCGFDFVMVYGTIGKDYAECHHMTPVSQLQENQTTQLSDLAIVCANCHRMLHRAGVGVVQLRLALSARAR